jgi:hypothetical protein
MQFSSWISFYSFKPTEWVESGFLPGSVAKQVTDEPNTHLMVTVQLNHAAELLQN